MQQVAIRFGKVDDLTNASSQVQYSARKLGRLGSTYGFSGLQESPAFPIILGSGAAVALQTMNQASVHVSADGETGEKAPAVRFTEYLQNMRVKSMSANIRFTGSTASFALVMHVARWHKTPPVLCPQQAARR